MERIKKITLASLLCCALTGWGQVAKVGNEGIDISKKYSVESIDVIEVDASVTDFIKVKVR